jgi:plasmid stabilization system protein ParE
MSLPVVFRREAKAEFQEAIDWYEARQAGLGKRFLACVEETLERVKKAPEIHGVVYEDVRCALVRRFPYGVYYRPEPDRVIVFAVFHGKRDPEVWQRRVRQTPRQTGSGNS